jgi:sulfite exporter TauE/SafE
MWGKQSGEGVVAVPLSEDEQRILHEIERSFYEHDPAFARGVSQTTLYRHAGRNLKYAAAGFVVGMVVLLASFASSLILGMVGFLAMLASAFVFERNLRKMGRAGWQQVTQSMRDKGIGDVMGTTRSRLRDRFRRDDS